MKSNRVLSVLAAVVLSITVLGYDQHVAYADNPDRAIPAVGVSSPSAGTTHVVWSAPSETGILNSYRVSWSQATHGITTYKAANWPIGGNECVYLRTHIVALAPARPSRTRSCLGASYEGWQGWRT